MTDTKLLEQVTVAEGTAKLRQNGRTQDFEIKELPEEFVRWQLDYKQRIYATIEKDEYVAFNAGHLPVIGTWTRIPCTQIWRTRESALRLRMST